MRAKRAWKRAAAGMGILLAAGAARAGNLNSPAGTNSPASAMYTVTDIYNRLNTGAAGAKRAGGFVEPASTPGSTGHTLDELMAKAPATNANAVGAGEVLSGKMYWGLSAGAWGTNTGTMANHGAVNITPGVAAQAIPAGYHNGSGTVAGDADLVSGNIRAGQNIFGVTGDVNVVNTVTGDATAADIASGKKAWVDGAEVTGAAYPAPVAKSGAGDLAGYTEVAGEDGHASMQKGVAWPSPRFTDNGDGTVKDNLTGLVWLKKANYINTDYSGFDTDGTAGDGRVTWQHALDFVAAMNAGTYGNCGQTDWRLPNVQELQSLIDYGRANPALCNAAGTGQWTSGDPFNGVQSYFYWSATTWADGTTSAWGVALHVGTVGANVKSATYLAWPVRGGQ
jgi:hypothetical protein